MDQIDSLLEGSVDMHIHSGPGLISRSLDHVEAAQEAMAAGQKAIVIKDQHIPSAETANIIQKYIVREAPFHIYGSVALNNAAGGVNPRVVEAALGCGAKVIWMPTLSARFHKEGHAKMTAKAQAAMPKTKFALSQDPPLSVLKEDGSLLDEVYEICELIAQKNVVLGTGHLSWPETYAVIKAAKEAGVEKIVVDHPEHLLKATAEQMQELTAQGVYVEHVLALVYSNKSSHEKIYEMIREHGVEYCVVASDLGQVGRPHPVEGMRNFIADMLKFGLTESEIRKITSENPGKLLGV